MSIFTDQLNRKINLPSPPKRIISLVPSQTELLYDLGLRDEVVGITKFCIHPEEWFRTKTRVGGTKKYDFEKIKALQPDLIIGNKEENEKEQIEELMKHYNVWMSDIYTLKDALGMIASLGALLGRNEEATNLKLEIEMKFHHFQNHPPTPFKGGHTSMPVQADNSSGTIVPSPSSELPAPNLSAPNSFQTQHSEPLTPNSELFSSTALRTPNPELPTPSSFQTQHSEPRTPNSELISSTELQTPNFRLRTAYFIWRKPYMAAGHDTFINEMLNVCGFENVFTDKASRYPEVTTEEIIAAKPQLILLSSEPYPFKEQHILEFKEMLPEAKIRIVDGELFSWYGSRLLKAPDYFRELISSI